jgi:hypothetical protein
MSKIKSSSNPERNQALLERTGNLYRVIELDKQLIDLRESTHEPCQCVYDVFQTRYCGERVWIGLTLYVTPDGPGVEVIRSASRAEVVKACELIKSTIQIRLCELIDESQCRAFDAEEGFVRPEEEYAAWFAGGVK